MDHSRHYSDDRAYEAAILHCANQILPMHFGERLVNKIFGRNIQSHAAGLLVVMHCESVLGRGAPPTLGKLQAEIGSQRTLASFFALLKVAGYIEAEPRVGDRRMRILKPKEPLLNGLKTWLGHHLHCAEIASLARSGLAQRLAQEEAFRLYFLAGARPVVEKTRALVQKSNAWAFMDSFDCGDRLALSLIKAHFETGGVPYETRWFASEARDLAARLGISYSHVRNIINAAEAEGLLLQDRARHQVALDPRFLGEIRQFHLTFWGWLAEIAHQADESLRQPLRS